MNTDLENFRFEADPFGLCMPLVACKVFPNAGYSSLPQKSNIGAKVLAFVAILGLLFGAVWLYCKIEEKKEAEVDALSDEKK